MNKSKYFLQLLLWAMLFLIFLAFSCGPRSYALIPEAIPMKQDGDRVLAIFQSTDGKANWYHAQWFYFPGYSLIDPHNYRIRMILERRQP